MNLNPAPPPPTTIGDITTVVNGIDYDHEKGNALTILINDPIEVVIGFDGDADPEITWGARNDYPLEVAEDGNKYLLTFPQEGSATATVTLSDPTATDSPKSAAINFYVVDAKTWEELKNSTEEQNES